MYYVIRETLQASDAASFRAAGAPYVAVLSSEEWKEDREEFDLGIDMEREGFVIHNTKAEVNYDSLTGTFCLPDRSNLEKEYKFSFALDEKGIIFIDDEGYAGEIVRAVQRTKKWRLPRLARFFYDFLEQIIHGDLTVLERYERQLDDLEEEVLAGGQGSVLSRVSDIRNDMRDFRVHYEQLMDLSKELEENENQFFKTEEERYFRMFADRVDRLRDMVIAMRDHAIQIRDLYQTELDIRQNRTMTLLTVITSIFMPLTLITGWYGMNFRYMPELEQKWAYPAVLVLCLVIVIACLWYFKKKKWL